MTMNITWKKTDMAMLLAIVLIGTSTASAEPAYAYGIQDKHHSNQAKPGKDDKVQSADRNSLSDSYRNVEQSRRDPRMSQDERRALRRQIDEAGRDIYAPRR